MRGCRSSGAPLVTVGVPVYNEELSLPAALDSLLAQDYENVEIVICDNASTDGTPHIARAYASRDERVSFHPSETNARASSNFNRAFRLSSGRYFTWARGHDMRELIGEGIVVSIDIDIREHNRAAVEEHPLGARVNFVEGSSTAPDTLDRVRALIPDDARVMVILDSNHTHRHVLDELRLYGSLVTEGQLLVVSDTIIEDIPPQTHRPREWGPGNNPKTAVQQYLGETDRFELDPWFNSKLLITSSRGGYLRCVAP